MPTTMTELLIIMTGIVILSWMAWDHSQKALIKWQEVKQQIEQNVKIQNQNLETYANMLK